MNRNISVDQSLNPVLPRLIEGYTINPLQNVNTIRGAPM